MSKTIRLDGEIGWEITASSLAFQMEGETDVDLIINTPGGSIVEGFAIFNLIKDFEGTITAKIDLAASMGSVIAMAADKVVMRSNSSLMMIHRPWGVGFGEAEDLRDVADTLDKLESMLIGLYMEKVGDSLSEDDLKQMLADTTWLDGSEALEFGFADELAEDDSKNMLSSMLVAMSKKHSAKYDLSDMAAKIRSSENKLKRNLKSKLSETDSLAQIEDVLRNSLNISRSEATAIVSEVKNQVHGDRDPSGNDIAKVEAELLAVFDKYK
jgi:ATP-dependent protease ClpP protease subunit